jgi:hypothetical protein
MLPFYLRKRKFSLRNIITYYTSVKYIIYIEQKNPTEKYKLLWIQY